jgi:hypothetical protein
MKLSLMNSENKMKYFIVDNAESINKKIVAEFETYSDAVNYFDNNDSEYGLTIIQECSNEKLESK